MTESTMFQLIAEIEAKAQRCQDRGLEHGATMDIVQAQMALGCKRGMAELRRLMGYQIEAEKRIRAEQEAVSQRHSRKRASSETSGMVALAATGSHGR